MSYTAETVLGSARGILSDPDKQRWVDSRLLQLLNEGIRDLVLSTKILKGVKYVALETNVREYDLSDYALEITRVQYMQYPIITDVALSDNVVYTNFYGGLIYISLVDEVHKLGDADNAGSVTWDPADTPDKYLIVKYVTKPKTITTIGDNMEVDEIWTQALAHYVAGRALRDDQDTSNRQVGNEELALYQQQIERIQGSASKSFTSGTAYSTLYRGIE